MASLSFVAHTIPTEKHPVHMAICEGTLLIGLLLGNTLNGALVSSLGLDTITYINFGLSVLPCFIIVLGVVDTTVTRPPSQEWKWTEILGWKNLSSAFRCILKKREGKGRVLLILTFLLYAGPYIAAKGFSSISFLYATKDNGMPMAIYSIFFAYHEAMKGFGGGIVLYITSKWFNIDFFHLMIISTAVQAFGFISMTSLYYPVNIWLGATLFGGYTLVQAQVRCLQAKLCEQNEVGKIFAFDSIFQALMHNAADIAFHSIYGATFQIWSRLCFAISTLILIFTMLLEIAASILKDKHDLIRS